MRYDQIEIGEVYEIGWGWPGRIVDRDPHRVVTVHTGARWDIHGHPSKPRPRVLAESVEGGSAGTPMRKWVTPQQVHRLWSERADEDDLHRSERHAFEARLAAVAQKLDANVFVYTNWRGDRSDGLVVVSIDDLEAYMRRHEGGGTR